MMCYKNKLNSAYYKKLIFNFFLAIIALPLAAYSQQNTLYKNLALEGGGIRGIAYAGAFKVLEQRGMLQHIENIAGSSAGAIAGLLLAIGFNASEIDSIMMHLPYQKFNDGRGGLLGKYIRVKRKYGVYKGDMFENWLELLLLQKMGNANLTFIELHQKKMASAKYKDLFITGTNVSKQRLEVFSYLNTPKFKIATAVRISGGIPLYFTPIALTNNLQKVTKGDTAKSINYYVDGGLLCNYPISMFDTCITGENPLQCNQLIFNKYTLGIKLERPEQIEKFIKNDIDIPAFTINNVHDFVGAYANLQMEATARHYPKLQNEMGRSIYMSYGNISPRIKKMSFKNKRFLYNNGVIGAQQFLSTLDALKKLP